MDIQKAAQYKRLTKREYYRKKERKTPAELAAFNLSTILNKKFRFGKDKAQGYSDAFINLKNIEYLSAEILADTIYVAERMKINILINYSEIEDQRYADEATQKYTAENFDGALDYLLRSHPIDGPESTINKYKDSILRYLRNILQYVGLFDFYPSGGDVEEIEEA